MATNANRQLIPNKLGFLYGLKYCLFAWEEVNSEAG